MVPPRRPLGLRAGQDHAAAWPTAASMSRPTQPGRISLPVTWGRYRLDVVERRPQHSADVHRRSMPASTPDASADTPDLLEIALDKTGIRGGRHHDGRRYGAHRRQGHAQRRRRQAARHRDAATCRPGTATHAAHGRPRLGHGRLCRRDLAPAARRQAASRMPGRAIGVQWFCDRPHGAHARARYAAAEPDAPERHAARSGQARRPGRRRGGARSSSPRSMSAFST